MLAESVVRTNESVKYDRKNIYYKHGAISHHNTSSDYHHIYICIYDIANYVILKKEGNALKIIIYGRPATKKNSSRVVRQGKFTRVLPSKAFCEYEKLALQQLFYYRRFNFSEPISVCCRYFLPNKQWWPDLVGLLQSTSDILQSAHIISDDKIIADYNGSCIVELDKGNPRVEIEINPVEHTLLQSMIKKYRSNCYEGIENRISASKNY